MVATLNLIEEYFEMQKTYQEKYGNLTIVLMQVGSFHEAYQTMDQGYDLSKLAEILNIIVSKRNKSILQVDLKNPYMMGFPSISLSKFLKILVDNGYTVVIVDQVTPPPNPKREITGIYSPGTYCEEISNPDANYLISIYVEEIVDDIIKTNNNIFLTGTSIIDVTTGKSYIYECYSVKNDENIALDDITKIIQSYPSKEIIITTNNLVSFNTEKLVAYLELTDKLYNHQTITQLTNNKNYKNVPKISYQQEILKKVYISKLSAQQQNNVIESLDLEQLNHGRMSLIILLNYINEHNPSLIKNLNIPEIVSNQQYMYLGNNAVYQLNIFNNDVNNSSNLYSHNTQYKCLFDVINKTSTPMGRRYLKNALVNPHIDVNKINNRYNILEYWLKDNKWKNIEEMLKEIPDIERYFRKVSIQQIHPIDFNNLVNGIKSTFNLINNLDINVELVDSVTKSTIIAKLSKLIKYLDNTVNYDEMAKYLINDITGNVFKEGIYSDIDQLSNEIKLCDGFINLLASSLNSLLVKLIPKKKSKKTLDVEFDDEESEDQLVKIDFNERDGYHLVLTKRRAELLQAHLEKNKILNVSNLEINVNNIEFRSLPKGNNCKIFIPDIQKKSNKITDLIDELRKEMKNKYVEWLNNLNNEWSNLFNVITEYVSIVDFCKSGCKVANQNAYNKPIINNKYNNKSYLKSANMRHPICEKLLTDTEYVPISIELGTENQNGILLFGLNSVGKSTLQKSIGINIILAQIGYYVAASNFEYYPYTTLMTRIAGNDNIFKGLSSFTLEIYELRAILKRSNMNTLVIADEVCKGTEHQSSLIIVMTMLEILTQNKCSFITATHLHDLTTIPRLYNLNTVKLYHLHVDYDEKNNTLKYNRVLKEGPGENFYGLNVAKYLINDSNFLQVANSVKSDIYKQQPLVGEKTSKYNSDLWINECQICSYTPINENDKPLETHHIHFQRDTNEKGFLTAKPHIHKNHKSNLCVLCSKCHDKIDTGELVIYGYTDTITGASLKYTLNDKQSCPQIISVEQDNVSIQILNKVDTLEDKIKKMLQNKCTQKKILLDLKNEGSQYAIKKIINNLKTTNTIIDI